MPQTGLEREGITAWDFGDLPESVESHRGGIRLKGFPALVVQGDSVAVRVLDSRQNAGSAHRAGVRRLLTLCLSKEMRYLRRNLPDLQRMSLQYGKVASAPKGLGVRGRPDLEGELITLILDLTFIEGLPDIRDRESFLQRIESRKPDLMNQAGEALQLLRQILEAYQRVRKQLSGITQINWMASVTDIRQQLDSLIFQGFLQHTPYHQLKQVPRYLKAIEMRLGKLPQAAARDQKLLLEMQGLYQRWQEREEKYRSAGKRDERVEELRWAFQELRVSLFAQELGTSGPVSLKRIEKRWKELGL